MLPSLSYVIILRLGKILFAKGTARICYQGLARFPAIPTQKLRNITSVFVRV